MILTSTTLSSLGVPHAFSTRVGGVSPAPFDSLNFGNPSELSQDRRDPVENIRANFARVVARLNTPTRQIVEVHQVHGPAVHVVRPDQPAHAGPSDTKADAIVTDDPSRLLAVRVADCTPILLASSDGGVVAAVHAGWRGVIAGVLPAAIGAMRALGAGEIHGAIGPCISAAHFQIGPEVAAEFRRVFGHSTAHVRPDPAVGGKFLADLKGALGEQLRDAGIGHVDTLPHCTVAQSELFFSHRRDNGVTGRMIAIIGPAGGV